MSLNPFTWLTPKEDCLKNHTKQLDEFVKALCFSLTTQTNQWKPSGFKEGISRLSHTSGILFVFKDGEHTNFLIRRECESALKSSDFSGDQSTKIAVALKQWKANYLTEALFVSSEDKAAWVLAEQAAKVGGE